MKKLVLITLAASAMILSTGSHAMDKNLEARLVDLCVAVKSDDRFHLIKEIKANNLRANDVVEGLVCNGEDAITFAKLNGAERTANMLIKHSGHEGKNVIIKDLAKN